MPAVVTDLSLLLSAGLMCAGLSGCAVEQDDMLGRYRVEWTRVDSCGDSGLLASPTGMTFNIALRIASADSLQWIDRGETTTLFAVGDGSYHAQVSQMVDARAGVAGAETLPECLIQRLDTLVAMPDQARGKDDFETFSADLRFAYDAADGSSCQDLMTAGGFAVGLPCAVVYDGVGERIE